MSLQVFAIPNFRGNAEDLVLCNASDPNANGVVHYAYTVGAEADAVSKRTLPWAKIREFGGEYGRKHPEIINRLKNKLAYRPGEGVLDSVDGPTFATDHDTIMRLGALELLANLSSGRLSTTDKDPFPHQLALQQYLRKPPRYEGLRRILIADEVGLGKTIEVGLILRDILLARGRLDGFRCLYLTSGGLVPDAADKLRDVLSGIIDGDHIVNTVSSFRNYGRENILGVHVASMHAARLYATNNKKAQLPERVRPQIVIIDECHHAASEGDLAGKVITPDVATQTYMTAKQLLAGEFWADSEPPQLAVLMSATPFRSGPQFVNLLRLLAHGVEVPGADKFAAYDASIQAPQLRKILQDDKSPASVVWRRQTDEGVRSWSGSRIFPNLTVMRPHTVADNDPETPRLRPASSQFLQLLANVKSSVVTIARAHGQGFGGFAIAQLEKKLTSSSIAGACWLFSWAVRHCQWDTIDNDYRNDQGEGTEGLRRLIRKISQRIAEFNTQSTVGHATVRFPSDAFEFDAKSLAQRGVIPDIQKYSKIMREDALESSKWVASQTELAALVDLGERLLELGLKSGEKGSAEDAKLSWLNEMLTRHPNDRFLLFTESLQTCETLESALGSMCRTLVGSMSKSARNQAVADLRNPRMNARVLVATSAADEGFDLQVATKVVHWDLSSSPATLMQRNGRVARLGQVTDVIAYYLILTGTHEERRDSALQAKFADLGIDDEALKSRILGSLSEEEEARLEQAIEDNEDGVVGNILTRATDDNEKMDQELAEIRTNLEYAQVLSRDDLAERLAAWKSMGLPDGAVDGINFSFDTVTWDRPVFAEVSRMESTQSTIARIEDKETKQKQELVFDPEFLVFGPKDSAHELKLAGIPPWINSTNHHDRRCIVPYDKSDLLGKLFQGIARLRRADFLSVSTDSVGEELDLNSDARWLLFCTHPLREAENIHSPKPRPFLTYYSFAELVDGVTPMPLDEEGADAAEVHKFIRHLENLAANEAFDGMDDRSEIDAAKRAGAIIQSWVESVTLFGAASFLDEEKYFVPIPVALVRLRSTTLHGT
jgi:superfamily II DNA or RNA helicase